MAINFGLAKPVGSSDYLAPLQALALGQQSRRTELAREAQSALLIQRGQRMPGNQPNGSSALNAPMPSAAGINYWERLAAADPAAALDFEDHELKGAREQIATASKLYGGAVQLLGGVHDQASLDAARVHAERMFGQYGLDLDQLGVPRVYSPDAIKALTLSAMEGRDQLSAMRADQRLRWDIADDQHDNERSDRQLDAVITDREERLRLARRGQDIASSDRRRGQDVRDHTTRRGQDMRPTRQPSRTPARPTATGPNGEKVQWDGKSWVPLG